MKKKLALILIFLFSALSMLTGCNLFDTNNYASLSSIVATSGGISITREQLINAYNSSGYQYKEYYGKTMEQALKMTIGNLIDRQVLLDYISELEKTDSRYALTSSEIYDIVKQTWEHLDSSITSIVEEVRTELNLSVSELSTEDEEEEKPEFPPRTSYTQKFYLESGKVLKIEEGESDKYVPNNYDKYDYKLKLNNKDYETLVFNKLITALKKSQKYYNYADKSDKATLNREIDRIYKTNLENAKLEKFEKVYTDNFGLSFDEELEKYFVNNKTLLDVIDTYKNIYQNNQQLYKMSYEANNLDDIEINLFYDSITSTTNREKFFYFGNPSNDETLLTCLHILVKLSDSQLEQVKEAESDVFLQQNLEQIVSKLKSPEETLAFERNENSEVIDEKGISVSALLELLKIEIQKITVSVSHPDYINQITEIFNQFIYKYNVDPGILNAKFDYVVGTKTSSMVNSFTEVVRKLYNNGRTDLNIKSSMADYNEDITLSFPYGVGYKGAISGPFLEDNKYSGYHIVLFTGTLENSVGTNLLTAENVYEKLSQKTSLSYNQSIFEFVFEKLTKGSYNNYQKEKIETFREDIKYNSANFSDMY